MIDDTRPELPPKLQERSRYWFLHQDKIWVRYPGRSPRLAVPHRHRRRVCHLFHGHALAGHPGVRALKRAISANYFMPNLAGHCSSHIRACDTCLRVKPSNQRHGQARASAPPSGRWNLVQVDFITGLPLSNSYDSICTFIDAYSKRVILAPCKSDITAPQFADLYIDHLVRQHGPVPVLLSDRGTQFTAEFWKQASARLGTDLKFGSTDHHAATGLVERTNRHVTQTLRALCHDHPEDWHRFLAIAEFSINNTFNSSIGCTPFVADRGYSAHTIGQPPATSASQSSIQDHVTAQRHNLAIIDDSLAQAREVIVSKAKRTTNHIFAVGDDVLIRASRVNTDADRADSSKLHAKYRGPFIITKALEYDNYMVDLPPSSRTHNLFHASDLHPYTAAENNDVARPTAVHDDFFLAEKILNHRGRGNRRRYLIKWNGYPKSAATWEPIDHLQPALSLVTDYCRKHNLVFPHRTQ